MSVSISADALSNLFAARGQLGEIALGYERDSHPAAGPLSQACAALGRLSPSGV